MLKWRCGLNGNKWVLEENINQINILLLNFFYLVWIDTKLFYFSNESEMTSVWY